ncbi:aldolase/citrate lyase family protein [Candidatus Manganitrophus noduliformans]|uniref:Siderophore biosynthesis protein SbnG n=1 Tax=Candidatus Manganitrophus noduliformans TaxID=2606439 RepID=A0A7X6DUI6_9BACT|nr:aldolase/citrate lyase family protein [Candidatus Manganitrophus noduliformans]NKE73560.1 siderophore biosynthesis protein SbnG [Candidatus Manganitrophus noduliformans]
MLRINTLKQALREGRPAFGLFCSTPAPQVVERIGCAGFDFVILDTEHTLVNPETLEEMLRAAEAAGLIALVRVPQHAPGAVLRALDAGALGVVVPRVCSAAEAETAVRASRYHPEGERGLNAGRAAGYGKIDLFSYLQQANAEVMVVVMIEDRQGILEAGKILSVPGIDMVLEGAADLSQSLGLPWQTRHPAVREALCDLQTAAQRQGVPFCAVPRVAEDFGFWWGRGVRAHILGEERGIAYRALAAHLQRFKTELKERKEGP